jgi:hypothetical protein
MEHHSDDENQVAGDDGPSWPWRLLIVISYDAPETHKKFSDSRGITEAQKLLGSVTTV